MADKLKSWRDNVLKYLNEICSPDGRVPGDVAKKLVEGSAWWESHPSGPVRAPRHADRIKGCEKNWSVEFGANSFLVSAAVHSCCQCIRRWIQQQQAQPTYEAWTNLNQMLQDIVRSPVANYRGDRYSGYGHGTQSKLIFGAQAIDVNDFVGGIARYLKTPALNTFQKRMASTPPQVKGNVKASINPTICPQCRTEVNASNLESHMRERCPKREGKTAAVPTMSKPSINPPVNASLTTKLGSGYVLCPRCQRPVKAEHLKAHLERAGTCCSPKKSRKKTSSTTDASPVLQQMPRPLGKNEVVCPWCNTRMNKATLASHQSDRCPNRPSLTAKISGR